MTARLGLMLAALLALSACEDLTDMMGVGPADGAEYAGRDGPEL